MRRLPTAIAVLVAARAGATPPRSAAPDPDRGVFWRDITEPHKDELDVIRKKARDALTNVDNYVLNGEGVQYRDRVYREVYGMLRFARHLAPDDVDLLTLLGRTADTIGKTREAIDALTKALEVAGPEKAGIDVTGRLGSIYLRLGKLDEAIRYLRAAQGPLNAGFPMSARVLIDLSTALALRGQMGDAIDVLSNALPTQLPGYYPNEVLLVSFALAVQYDRDEQRGAAFDVIDHLDTALQGQLVPQLQAALNGMRFAPPEDQHYYLALMYEVGGYYPEARAEWALYAATGDAPWRARALDHIAAIDGERRAVRPGPQPATGGVILRRHP